MEGENNQAVASAPVSRPIWDKISFAITVAMVFLLPLFFVPSPWLPFTYGKVFLAIFGAILAASAWIIARLRGGSLSYVRHPIYLSMGAVVLTLFLSTVFSSDTQSSLLGAGNETTTFAFLAAMFVLTFVISTLNRSRDRVFYTYLSLFASFLAVSLFHLIRLFAGPDALSFGIFTTAIGNTVGKWNDLGIIFGLGAILSLITLELITVKAALKYALYAVLAFSLFFLTLVNFLSVWIALAAFSLLLFVYLVFIHKRGEGETSGKRVLPVVPLVVLAISLIFVIPTGRGADGQMRYVGSRVNDTLAARFGILHLEVRPTWSATLTVAADAFKKDPVFGVGPNHFVNRWLENKPAEVNATAFWNADFAYGIGFLPTMFVSTGLLGTLAWLVFLALLAYTGFRAILSGITDPFSRYLTISSFLSSLFLWVFSFIYVPSTVPLALAFIFTGVFLGALVQSGVQEAKELSFVEKPRVGFASVLGLVFTLILAVVSLYVYTEKTRGVMAFQHGAFAFSQQGDVAAAENYFKAAANASRTDTYYRFLSELTLIKINTLLSQSPEAVNLQQAQQELLQLFGEAKQYAETAVDIEPTSYQNWLSLGRVYEALVPLQVEGAYDEAVKAYDAALLRNPRSPEIYLIKARLEVAHGKNDIARQHIGQALTLKANYTEAVFFLSQIEVAEGNLKQAISSVEASIFLSPQEPVLYFQLGLLKYNTNDYKGAVEALEQAVRLNPSYANARYFLGLSYDKAGRTEDAVAQFKAVQQTNPDNQEVQTIIANLEAGRAPFAPAREPVRRAELPVEEPTPDAAVEQ